MPTYEKVEFKEPDPVFCTAESWQWYGPGQMPEEAETKEPGWYFWDEVWCYPYGPFTTEEKCRAELVAYCKSL